MNGEGFQVGVLTGQLMSGHAGKDCSVVLLRSCVHEGGGGGGKARGWIHLHTGGDHNSCRGRDGQAGDNHTQVHTIVSAVSKTQYHIIPLVASKQRVSIGLGKY